MARPFAARRSLAAGSSLLATGYQLPATGYRLTLANESFAHPTHLTYFQSLSPLASVNESFASVNDSLTPAIHLPPFQEMKPSRKLLPSQPLSNQSSPRTTLGGWVGGHNFPAIRMDFRANRIPRRTHPYKRVTNG
jgi:hypothetical protein